MRILLFKIRPIFRACQALSARTFRYVGQRQCVQPAPSSRVIVSTRAFHWNLFEEEKLKRGPCCAAWARICDLERPFSTIGCGCSGNWICAGPHGTQRTSSSLGAGQVIAFAGRWALPGWARWFASGEGAGPSSCGCTLGDGGRVARRVTGGSAGRNLGRPGPARFYGNQTPERQGAHQRCSCLDDPQRLLTKLERCAQSLACRLNPLFSAYLRSQIARGIRLESGAFSFTRTTNRAMDGAL